MTEDTVSRTTVSFDAIVRHWLESNYREPGYSTVSKMVNDIVTGFMKGGTLMKREEQINLQLPPQEEYARIIEEMGAFNQKFDEKFLAIRTLVPGENSVEDIEDPQNLRKILWRELCAVNGSVRIKGKLIAITREDLDNFQKLGMLYMRKVELEKELNLLDSSESSGSVQE